MDAAIHFAPAAGIAALCAALCLSRATFYRRRRRALGNTALASSPPLFATDVLGGRSPQAARGLRTEGATAPPEEPRESTPLRAALLGTTLFTWYNTQHRHDALALLTPHDVHHDLVRERLSQRRHVLASAYAAHPERFVRRPPVLAVPPEAVWINPPKPKPSTQEPQA